MMKPWVLGAAALCAAVSAGPAPADDDTDDSFIAALQQHGISFADRDATIEVAHGICAALDRHQPPTTLLLTVIAETDLSPHQAGYLLGAAVMSYCPKFSTAVDNAGA